MTPNVRSGFSVSWQTPGVFPAFLSRPNTGVHLWLTKSSLTYGWNIVGGLKQSSPTNLIDFEQEKPMIVLDVTMHNISIEEVAKYIHGMHIATEDAKFTISSKYLKLYKC